VPIHVGSQIGADTGENDADILARQIGEQVAHGLRGGEVYIFDRSCIDDEPADRRRRVATRARTSSVKR